MSVGVSNKVVINPFILWAVHRSSFFKTSFLSKVAITPFMLLAAHRPSFFKTSFFNFGFNVVLCGMEISYSYFSIQNFLTFIFQFFGYIYVNQVVLSFPQCWCRMVWHRTPWQWPLPHMSVIHVSHASTPWCFPSIGYRSSWVVTWWQLKLSTLREPRSHCASTSSS